MAKNHHKWGNMQHVTTKSTPKTGELYKVSPFDHMNVKVDGLYQKSDSLSITTYAPVPPTRIAYVTPAAFYYEIKRINEHAANDF